MRPGQGLMTAWLRRQHCSELQHRKSLSQFCWTLDMESHKYKAAPYNVSNCPILHTMLGRQLANTGVLPQCSRQPSWGWSHPFIAFFPVVLNI